MKRFTGLYLACLLLLTMTLTGCGTESESRDSSIAAPTITAPAKTADDEENVAAITPITDAPPAPDRVINVFSMTDEVYNIIKKYKELHPDFPYEFKLYSFATIDGDFHAILDEYLAKGGADAPDIYCIEDFKAMNYTQGDAAKYAAPYKELGIDVDQLTKEADIAPYVIDVGTNSEGKVVGLAFRGTGGAFIYRRSIAKDVWGTDEPDVIKDKIGPGWEKFFQAAAELKAKGYGIVSGDGDIWHPINDSADMPWVVKGKLYIDPKREAFFDYAKLLKDKGYSNDTTDWTTEWYDDMKGIGEKEIFGFFGPSWLINYVMMNNCGGNVIGEGTYGDWAVCEPPVGFFWGGGWIFANKNSEHKEAIGDIIKWINLDSSETGFQYSFANGTFDGNNGVMEAVASGTVMKNSEGKLDFLGNQNMFEVFDKAAKLANGRNLTPFDENISSFWREQVREYTAGNKTKEQAIADFKQAVKEKLGIAVE